MKKIFLTGLFLANSLWVQLSAQHATPEIKDFSNLFYREHTHRNIWTQKHSNELEWMLGSLFLTYKNFFSSQDGASCTFRPSCSEYALEFTRRFGLLRGVPATFDRLSRCNGLSAENYEQDIKSGLFLDPVPLH